MGESLVKDTRLSSALTAARALHLKLRAPTCEIVESENEVCFPGLELGGMPGCMVVDGTGGCSHLQAWS